ncbi:DUF2076 domain-containing protein [Pseudomonas sp. WS 5111]|jgi:hypothetical protein|uniref:DUF2076 domain-containing protein n=1 Tax=unclassified Pseudomonas TaxID=196821 RepID=UPI001475D92E|nr:MULTISPECIES: DUF2076 domain-containing protein [unclassified Pseudomonas]NMX65921.1 DUF2076 domain-containing protein [Pseudomonas sp. WS 5111]NMX85823.1 DUF2076 domain-containing protein [Pseudomonas sp. WS 5010]
MNSEEQTLIDGLFSRLQQAETDSAPRDAQAEARIKEHITRQPAAGYFMTQAILVQEAAIKSLDAQNKQQAQQIQQLQDELQRARTTQPATSGGGFLSSIFGASSREPQPATSAPASNAGGWREPTRPGFNSAPAPQQNYQQPQQAAPAGGGFLGGALKTAAGVAGGVMLAQGISSLFSHNQQPQVVEEIIREEPAPASDNSGWGNDSADTYADSGYADDSSFLGDDDSFV